MSKKKNGKAAARKGPNQTRVVWASVAAGVMILASTFAVIHSTHNCRTLYAELQVLESAQWYLQEDYGRLLLEQSTWASHYRVEKVARSELGMDSPELASYKVLAK